jgi:rSAM/selenodomain-associated transferase 2
MNGMVTDEATDTITVIIPTLNEEHYIVQTISSLRQAGFKGKIIVVDGGSTDSTIELCSGLSAVQLIKSPKKGRGFQMNIGAQEANENYLLFLHGDSIFPPEGITYLLNLIRHGKTQVGSFSLAFDNNRNIYRLLSRFSRINHPLATYGDQGLFIKRSIYQRLGGFADIPLLEDVDIIRRIRKKYRMQKFPMAVVTSARRFERNGPLRQTIINIAIVLAYYLGCSPAFLHRFYR